MIKVPLISTWTNQGRPISQLRARAEILLSQNQLPGHTADWQGL